VTQELASQNLIFSYATIIQEIDVDAFGHLNNAQYLRLFEQARWDFISTRGYDLELIRREQLGPVILDVHLRFLRELKPRDQVDIRSQTLRFSGKVGQISQKMFRGEDLCADAVFTVGFWNLQSRKLVKVTPLWLAAIGVCDHVEN